MTDHSSPENAELQLADEIEQSWGLLRIVPGEGIVPLGKQKTAIVIAALRSSIRAQQMTWQPIETAPKDGSRILICREDRFPKNTYVARWLKDVWSIGPIGGEWHAYPTHWMPLPAGPSSTSPGCGDVSPASYCALCDLEHALHEDAQGFHHIIKGERVTCHQSAPVYKATHNSGEGAAIQPQRMPYPEPTREMLDGDPLFEAIWQAIKDWDISRHNNGVYSGPTGNDARHIYDAVSALTRPECGDPA